MGGFFIVKGRETMAQQTTSASSARDSFTSRTAFIIACIGSAVGLSGIWLFPYRVSQLGGAAFLIPYLFFVVLLGLTGVVGEMSFGRAMQTGPMGAFGKALSLRNVPMRAPSARSSASYRCLPHSASLSDTPWCSAGF